MLREVVKKYYAYVKHKKEAEAAKQAARVSYSKNAIGGNISSTFNPMPPVETPRESEKQLRERIPALQEAWDNYQLLLKLVDDRPVDAAKHSDYYMPGKR